MGTSSKTTMVGVRVDTTQLAKLEELGQQIQPKPLNRSEMINVAIRAYVEQHAKPKAKK